MNLTSHNLQQPNLIALMFTSSAFPFPPDPAARQLFTVAAFLPLCACQYLLAVLAILPHTYVLRLAFVPVVLWQAWCAVGLDFSAALARSLGRDSVDRLNHWNYAYLVRASVFPNPPFPSFFSRVFCSGGDNRRCTQVSRMGSR